MKQAVTNIIERAKEGLVTKHRNHDPSWPKHHLLCNCNKCMNEQFAYIKEMRKEARLAKAKAKQKVSK